MYGFRDGWMKGWMDGQADERTDGLMDGRVDGWTDTVNAVRTDQRADAWPNDQMIYFHVCFNSYKQLILVSQWVKSLAFSCLSSQSLHSSYCGKEEYFLKVNVNNNNWHLVSISISICIIRINVCVLCSTYAGMCVYMSFLCVQSFMHVGMYARSCFSLHVFVFVCIYVCICVNISHLFDTYDVKYGFKIDIDDKNAKHV